MTDEKEILRQQFLNDSSNHYILSLPTSFGKSKLALDKTNTLVNKDSKILIVVPRRILINNWKEEIKKWKYNHLLPNITFCCYKSIDKLTLFWDVVIWDEGHHITDRCKEVISKWNIKHSIVLSATLKRDLFYYLEYRFQGIKKFSYTTNKAIEEGILPEPKIILYGLNLNTIQGEFTIIKNPKGKLPAFQTTWNNRWNYWKQKAYKVVTTCNASQYYENLSSEISWYKRKAMGGNQVIKNMWLKKAGDRLKWLADRKTKLLLSLLDQLREHRVLTFCSSIEQAKYFPNEIHTGVGTANLDKFNKKKVHHITAVAMLDEGANLVDCQIGLFCMINSSDRINIQRVGRILRHKNPYIIIPYFKNTREQEIVTSIAESYNKKLVHYVSDSNSLLKLITQ